MAFPPPIRGNLNLLPLDSSAWDWKAFERFCLDLVNALPDVAHADFHGAQGDKQDGIDILAQLTNGEQRTYQCKKYKSFGPRRAEAAVSENTFVGANEHVLLVACGTSKKTQAFMRAQPGWRLLDQQGISTLVRVSLPREAARRLVDDHLGPQIRAAFLGSGPMTFVEPALFFAPFLGRSLFRHDWSLVGRDEILDDLAAALERHRIVVLPGRGGVGKTRLLRALAAQRGDRTLFALDDVPITSEAVDDLPFAEITVVVDDVHRRDDLGPLLSEAVRRTDTRLVLATRPQGLDELRAMLARAGYASDEVHVAEPLGDLPTVDVEALARQALGPEHAHLASALAAATADCPLVTVVGGQLLASRAVPPQLLERQQDFRDEVLARWQDELVGQLGRSVDSQTIIGLLRILAALAPFPAANRAVVAAAADELSVDAPEVLRLLGELEAAGLVIARGRLRRIVPDVLADHVLHRACVDMQGRPTGYAEQLARRYGALSTKALLRNLAALDWRIGQTAGASTVLDAVWKDWTDRFARTNADGRVTLLQRILPAAVFMPERVLSIVELALQDPARPVNYPFGASTTDTDVRAALAPLLARVGQHAEHAADALSLLWQLGRDEPGPLHSNPDHPIRLAQELADHSVSLVHDEAAVALVEQLIADGQADLHHWSPLELLRGLMSRTVERISTVGFEMHFDTAYVIAATTSDVRRRAFTVLESQAAQGTARTQHLAEDLLGEALRPPSTPGQGTSREHVDQWHDEELRLVAIAAGLIENGPPLARMEIRQRLSRYSNVKLWPDVAQAVQEAIEAPVDERERMLTIFADPFDLAEDPTSAQQQIDAYARELAHAPTADDDLATSMNDAIEQLDATTALHPNPTPVLSRIATENPYRGLAIARWIVERPDEPLARFVGALLGPLRRLLRSELEALLDSLDGNQDVRLRRMLALYLGTGTWYADPSSADVDRMRRLLVDEDQTIRSIVVHALPPLSTVDPALACELALAADTSDGVHARLVDHVLSSASDDLGGAQLETRMQALTREPRLAWSSWQLLAKTGETRPQRVLDLLLARARSDDSGMRPVFDAPRAADVLSGFDDDAYSDALRAVREQAREVKGRPRSHTGKLYWALDRNEDLSLAVLGEWLTADDMELVHVAAHLLDALPLSHVVPGKDHDGGWHLLLSHIDVVNAWLKSASRNGSEHRDLVYDALMVVMTSGMTGRGIGTPAERYITSRKVAREAAARLPAGSTERRFWTAAAAHADREIAEDVLEDEEFGEDML